MRPGIEPEDEEEDEEKDEDGARATGVSRV